MARLAQWNPAINLVAPASLAEGWGRHVLDSGQLLALAPEAARRWVDLGAGAGFPGLVVAALAAERRPGLAVTLVESDARKCAFLGEAARAMGVTVTVLRQRIEAAPKVGFDVVSARALARLPKLLDLAAPWLAPGGVCLFPKGADHGAELTEAAKRWHSAPEVLPSIAGPAGVVLRLTEVRRAAA